MCEVARSQRAAPSPVVNATGVVPAHQPRPRALARRGASPRCSRRRRRDCNLELDLETGGAATATRSSRTTCARSPAPRRRPSSTTTPPRVLLALNTLADGPRGGRLARRADRDRRLVPHPRRDGEERRAPARGRHDQPHAPRDYERAIGPSHRGAAARCTRATTASSASPRRSPLARAGRARRERGVPVIEDLGSGALVDLAPLRASATSRWSRERVAARRRPGDLQRRQAARRPAGGRRRRPGRS